MVDDANWDDYPKENPKDVDMDEDSNSSVKGITSLMHDISKVVLAAINITPVVNYSDKTNKQEGSNPMNIEDEDTSRSQRGRRLKQKENWSKMM